jgi:cytoskeletal protein RodZ
MDPSHSPHDDTPAVAPALIEGATVGDVLRQVRERQGLTLEQISDVTKIPVRHLDALERGDLAAVPPGMYQRAEIRAFAEAVGLNPRVALAYLERGPQARIAVPAPPEAPQEPEVAPTEFVPPPVMAPPQPPVSDPVPQNFREDVGAVQDVQPKAPAPLPSKAAIARAQSGGGVRKFGLVAALIVIAGIAWLAMRSLPNDGSVSQVTTVATSPAPTAPGTDSVAPASPPPVASESAQTTSAPPSTVPSAPAPTPAATTPAAAARATQVSHAAPVVLSPDLRIVSQPSGARVTVDGVGWGQTPVTIRYLPPGTKRVRVTRDGYLSQERTVNLTADAPRTTVNVTLRRR